MAYNDTTELPRTLNENGTPETRIGKATEVQDRIAMLIQADQSGRAGRRGRVKGLVDGNPPYRAADLRAAGTANRCNVNWRTAESYLNNGRSAFYDVFSEAATYATVMTLIGGPKRHDWSQIITKEFDRLLKDEPSHDYHHQISQYEMVLYGSGPLMFEDDLDWRTCSVLHRNMLLPEYAASDPNQWEECSVLVDYTPDKLYGFIRREKTAKEMGWDVAMVRKAIMNVSPRTEEGGQYATWEWHQQNLKNNSFQYSAHSKVVKCAHYFVREFPDDNEDEGKITHAIVLIAQGEISKNDEFLFKRVGRYKNWREVLHPLYYDNDGGGYHHSVTGLGVKMYSAMEAQNRLICNIFDKTFAPKQLFKPTSANSSEVMNIVHLGDYGKVPPDWEAIQMPVGSFVEESLALNRELSGTISANLSAYRQNLSKESGNPITAYEAGLRASEQTRLGKTQLNHFFAQMDGLYAEKYRRVTNPDLTSKHPGGKAAKEFIKRCEDQGVPLEALRKVESVKATRIIGQGSPFLRQTVTRELLGSSQLNPSSAGKMNILSDYYASLAGQAMVSRYLPEIVDFHATDQKAIATLQVSAARNGVPAVFSANQNHQVFAETFFEAIGTAFQSLQQGAEPQQVAAFVEALGGALIRHIQAMGEDPRNKQMADEFEKQWKKVAQVMDKLAAQIQQQQQQQAEAMQKQRQAQMMANGGDPEMALEAATQRAKLGLQKQKQDATMAMKAAKERQSMSITEAKARQDMALADARTAAEITNSSRKAEAATKGDE